MQGYPTGDPAVGIKSRQPGSLDETVDRCPRIVRPMSPLSEAFGVDSRVTISLDTWAV